MRMVMTMLVICWLSWTGGVLASEPNCTPQEEGVRAAKEAVPDSAKCAELKGKDKRRCEAEARNLVKKNLAVATKALACCKSPDACK